MGRRGLGSVSLWFIMDLVASYSVAHLPEWTELMSKMDVLISSSLSGPPIMLVHRQRLESNPGAFRSSSMAKSGTN